MVGVPRSKGCKVCVQRRVKCDQTRPICLRCQKANRECPGYTQDMKFQDEGPRLRQRFQKQESSRLTETTDDVGSSDPFPDSEQAEICTSVYSPSSPSAHDTSLVQILQIQDLPILTTSSKPAQSTPMVFSRPASLPKDIFDTEMSYFAEAIDCLIAPPVFAPTLEQEQLLYTFTSSIFPPGIVQMPVGLRHHTRWLGCLPPLSGQHALLDAAVRAVTLTHLGRSHNLESSIHQSRTYYGKALRLLNSTLQDPELGLATETLSATILLSFYEMFSSTSGARWIRHARGASTLMKLRGPSCHRYGLDREIFLSYRNAIVIEAFETDTCCFLDQPEWRKVMAEIYNDIRLSGLLGDKVAMFDLSEKFFREFVQLPGLMCDFSKLPALTKTAGGDSDFVVKGLTARLKMHRISLKNIHAELEAELKTLDLCPTVYLGEDPVFPVRYHYPNIFVATLYMGHWTLLIIINKMLRQIDCGPDMGPLYLMENADAAKRICECEAYMAASSFLGPFFLIFGLRLSLMVVDTEEERAWIIEKLMKLGETRLPIAKEMAQFRPDYETRVPSREWLELIE